MMERRNQSPGRTSTYGLACMQCFKAKCRCVPRGDGRPCERCHRLNKQCQPSDSARRRIAQKSYHNQGSEARIMQLEEKIDTLMSVLSQNMPRSVLNNISEPSNRSPSQSSTFATTLYSSGVGPLNVPGLTTPANSDPFVGFDTFPQQPEEALKFFRERMLPHFPFYAIPTEQTCWQLRSERPILFQAILTVTTFSSQKRIARAEEFKRLVFMSAFIETQSTLDLLLAILTYIAWSTDAFLGRANLLSRLTMLAISLVYDLQLFKPPLPDVEFVAKIAQGYSDNEPTASISSDGALHHFLELQRAVLACFVLSSNISSHFGRIDALRWTSQMEESLHALEQHKLTPTDESFIFQVRLQLLAQRVAHIREQHDSKRDSATASTASSSVPALLYLQSLLKQLQDSQSELSIGGPEQDVLIAYGQFVELYIYQGSLAIGPGPSQFNPSVSEPFDHDAPLPGYGRLEILWKSVESLKRWLEAFYRMSPSTCIGLPFHFWSQLVRCTVILKYLSTLDDPAWDCRAVQKAISIVSALETISQKLDETSREAGPESDNDAYRLLSKLMGRSREWILARWKISSQMEHQETSNAGLAGIPTPRSDLGHSSNLELLDLDGIPWLQSMDLESDKWFEDVLGWPTV